MLQIVGDGPKRRASASRTKCMFAPCPFGGLMLENIKLGLPFRSWFPGLCSLAGGSVQGVLTGGIFLCSTALAWDPAKAPLKLEGRIALWNDLTITINKVRIKVLRVF